LRRARGGCAARGHRAGRRCACCRCMPVAAVGCLLVPTVFPLLFAVRRARGGRAAAPPRVSRRCPLARAPTVAGGACARGGGDFFCRPNRAPPAAGAEGDGSRRKSTPLRRSGRATCTLLRLLAHRTMRGASGFGGTRARACGAAQANAAMQRRGRGAAGAAPAACGRQPNPAPAPSRRAKQNSAFHGAPTRLACAGPTPRGRGSPRHDTAAPPHPDSSLPNAARGGPARRAAAATRRPPCKNAPVPPSVCCRARCVASPPSPPPTPHHPLYAGGGG